VKEKLKILLELTKFRITSFVTVTTAFGFIAASGSINLEIIPVLMGILFLACGSAAFNQYQEKDIDATMSRTSNRPIPSKRITGRNALFVSLLLILSGSIILFFGAGALAFELGLLNLIWYNLVYTLLKRKTPFAIIPGSLVGAIPPAVGWVAAGGYLFDPQIIFISFFFFIWQIPHFWLLLLLFDKDYKSAGLPTLTQIFNKNQLARITFIWVAATAVTGLLIPLFGLVRLVPINLLLFFGGIFLTWRAFKLVTETENNLSFRFAFRYINLFALFVVVLVSLDKLILR
jgi:protoheme IX farnesyltransferase